jgi:hypothetical protein
VSYTFNPLPAIPSDHTGFGFILFLSVIFLLVPCMLDEDLRENWFFCFFLATIFCGLAYFVSFVWTDQESKPFRNEKVIGEFVAFQPEGYNERSGKSRVDRHYTYVVYSVNGNNVLLQAEEGIEYPQKATLYKN